MELYGPSRRIWELKYRFSGNDAHPPDLSVEDMWRRVATAVAKAEEPIARTYWARKFYGVLEDFKFLPAGRIIAGAGTGRDVTMSNCFTMGTIPDSLDGIFSHLREAALTLKQGGGIGYDFSTIRPKGAHVAGVDADASGPLSFMDVWDNMCTTLMSAGDRRGAMMATMHCAHPDIFEFVLAKQIPGRLTKFNLSVLVTDAFMKAVEDDSEWPLFFPCWMADTAVTASSSRVYKVVQARELWDAIMRATYNYAEPGVIFIDRINARHNLRYCEAIRTTNPCGEKAMSPYSACLLGSINLTAFVKDPFTSNTSWDFDALVKMIPTIIRMMDDVVDVCNYPLEQQHFSQQQRRQLGLGVTGLGDTLTMMGMRYGSKEAIDYIRHVMILINDGAYHTSISLAKEKGAFPLYSDHYEPEWALYHAVHDNIVRLREHGIRNALLTSIAPTGTISLLANCVSGGIEPNFAHRLTRKVWQADGSHEVETIESYALRKFQQLFPGVMPDLQDPAWITAQDLSIEDHLVMQAVCQQYVDSSISKTINIPKDYLFDDFVKVYREAYDMGCKGCTTYRPNETRGSVLDVANVDLKDTIDRAVCKAPLPCPNLDTGPPDQDAIDAFEAAFVAYEREEGPSLMAPTLTARPIILNGATHKIKWPHTDAAYYVTVNHDPDDTLPFEVFVNTRDVSAQAWIAALTRMISAILRRKGPLTFVAEELKAVHDPRGGAWLEGGYVPSLLAAIGAVIEEHLPRSKSDEPLLSKKDLTEFSVDEKENILLNGLMAEPRLATCPKCGSPSLLHQEGCDQCTNCNYSTCG